MSGNLSQGEKEEIAKAVFAHLDEFKKKVEKGDKKGDLTYIENFPMDSVVPLASLYFATHFASNYKEDDEFITLSFDMDHYGMLSKKQKALLKPIKGDFHSDASKKGDPVLI